MKSPFKYLAALVAVCFTAVAAFAADASPAGTWKYTQAGRGGNPGIERTLMLDFKDGKLTGTLKGASMGQFEIPDAAIGDASFKGGMLAFTVTTTFNDTKRVTKYEGKLEGDKITGSSEAPGRDGAVQKREWAAMRAK
jgi:hypothetical protein